jgi:hypothetical protein
MPCFAAPLPVASETGAHARRAAAVVPVPDIPDAAVPRAGAIP